LDNYLLLKHGHIATALSMLESSILFRRLYVRHGFCNKIITAWYMEFYGSRLS